MEIQYIAIFIPIIVILVGGAIALVAIVTEHKQKMEMVKQGMEISSKKTFQILIEVSNLAPYSLVLLLE